MTKKESPIALDTVDDLGIGDVTVGDPGEHPTLEELEGLNSPSSDGPTGEPPKNSELPAVAAPLPLYEPRMWRGVLKTFQCSACGFCVPDQGEMILHVVDHLPIDERNAALDELTKELPR